MQVYLFWRRMRIQFYKIIAVVTYVGMSFSHDYRRILYKICFKLVAHFYSPFLWENCVRVFYLIEILLS